MAVEDVVQFQDVKYVDFDQPGEDDDMIINHQAGFGVFTELGDGIFNLALTSDPLAVPPRLGNYKAPIPTKLLKVQFTPKQIGPGYVRARIDTAATTPTNIRVQVVDNTGLNTRINGCFTFSQCENFTQASK